MGGHRVRQEKRLSLGGWWGWWCSPLVFFFKGEVCPDQPVRRLCLCVPDLCAHFPARCGKYCVYCACNDQGIAWIVCYYKCVLHACTHTHTQRSQTHLVKNYMNLCNTCGKVTFIPNTIHFTNSQFFLNSRVFFMLIACSPGIKHVWINFNLTTKHLCVFFLHVDLIFTKIF